MQPKTGTYGRREGKPMPSSSIQWANKKIESVDHSTKPLVGSLSYTAWLHPMLDIGFQFLLVISETQPSLRALEEEDLGPFLGRGNKGNVFLIWVFWVEPRGKFSCSGTHSAGNSLVLEQICWCSFCHILGICFKTPLSQGRQRSRAHSCPAS